MRTITVLLLFMLPAVTQAFPGQIDYLAVLQKTAPKDRIYIARKIYNDRILHLDSAQALGVLNNLLNWADKINDIPLKTFSLIAISDYYKELPGHHEEKAIPYLNKALQLAQDNKDQGSEAEIYNNMGQLYYKQNKYPQAFEYMIRANSIIQDKIGYTNYHYSARYLYDLGYIYYDFGNYKRAKAYLSDAIKYPFSNAGYAIRTYNTLALAYRELEQFDSAILYFNKALDTANAVHDVPWIGIISGNLGLIYYWQKQYSRALALLQTDYTLSRASKEWASAANTLCTLADMELDNHQIKEAAARLNEAGLLLSWQEDNRPYLLFALKKAKLYKLQNRFDSAYIYTDSARRLMFNINKRRDAMVFSQAEQKVAVELHLSAIKLLEIEKSKTVLQRNFTMVIILLGLVIGAQFIFRLQLKQKKNKEQLNNAVQQLNYYVESIREKNQLIEQFKQEIEHLNALPEQATLQNEKEEIAGKLKQYTILTEDDWTEFRHLFEKVQKGFFDKLKQQYPDLTPAEQRLLALMKLNLSRKEMAGMLGIALDSIKKTRQRIRKKINVQDDDELEELVAAL